MGNNFPVQASSRTNYSMVQALPAQTEQARHEQGFTSSHGKWIGNGTHTRNTLHSTSTARQHAL